ncbi:MAG: hotdog fold thioesterase [Endozoicomonadaceae bacterium]|nr:hotdog fold thioesterase [Endozoicomonadaceae bacterium]MBE8232678.1 hotdog fold thioesterase [Endozoicomonadaceae bacterium]
MTIWVQKHSIQEINQLLKNTLCQHLSIHITEKTATQLIGKMPIDKRTCQSFGRLHGGASLVLAETLGSLAGNLCVSDQFSCVGVEINANHLLPVFSGWVTGIAMPLHLGRSTQVWEIKLYREDQRICCVARHTVAVITQENASYKA